MTTERNAITISPIQGEHILIVNGFKIQIVQNVGRHPSFLTFEIYRKGDMVKSTSTLQQAVQWCQD